MPVSDRQLHHAPHCSRDPDGFTARLNRLEAAGGRIWNAPPLVRWNLTKRYLLDLEAEGVPIVPRPS